MPNSLPPEIEDSSDDIAVQSVSPQKRDALELRRACEMELALRPEPLRAARLHFELARVSEVHLKDLSKAATHYQEALKLLPEHLPTIRGARRVLIERNQFASALPLFDAEARVTAEAELKAQVYHQKGRFLEDVMLRSDAAREAYAVARDLAPRDPSILKALEKWDTEHEAWSDLAKTYADTANAIQGDGSHRAALTVQRARLLETRQDEAEAAVELYEMALDLDPQTSSALNALKRLYHGRQRWREIIGALEREASLATAPAVKAMAYYRIGRTLADRLGSRDEAITALERAVEVMPEERLLLDELGLLYESAGRFPQLVDVLGRQAKLCRDDAERLALFHRIGEVFEVHVREVPQAVHWYEAALSVDPTYVPALRAISTIYTRQENWEGLIGVNLAEAEATEDADRRMTAYVRVAELLEFKLDRPKDAIEHHRRVLALAPDHPASFKSLARLFTAFGEYRELVELFDRAVEVLPDGDQGIAYLFRIGAIYEDNLAEPAQAAHTYRRILEREPDHLGAVHALQRATERAGRHEELVEALELEAEKTNDKARRLALLHRAGGVIEDKLDERDAALECFRRVLDLDGNYVPALRSLGRLYYRAGRWEDLLDVYQRELDIMGGGPKCLPLLQKMGELCEERIGDEEKALSAYRRAVSIDPTYRPALERLARKLRQRAAWPELVRILELELEGLEHTEAVAITSFRLGEILEEYMGQPDRSAEVYERSLAAMPQYRPAFDALTRVRTERKAWQSLVETLETEIAAERDPLMTIAALARQGEVYADHLGESTSAIACFEAVLERDPNHLGALLALEPLYTKVKDWVSLAALYERQAAVLRDRGARVAALRELARLCEREELKSPEELISVYEAIIRLVPHNLEALEALGQLVANTGDKARAAQLCAIRADYTEDVALQASLQVEVGESLEGSDDPSALQAFRAALEADPDSFAAVLGIARVAMRLDDPMSAALAARRHAELSHQPEEAAGFYLKGATLRLERLGDPSGALQDLERALEVYPDSQEVVDLLARMLRERGDLARLADILNRAAASASDERRSGALWRQVADLYAYELNNIAGALNALQRSLKRVPADLLSSQKIADIYTLDSQWQAAAKQLEHILHLGANRDTLCEAHLKLAKLQYQRLDAPTKAKMHLESALAINPDDTEALGILVDVHVAGGEMAAATSTARQLLNTIDPEGRPGALVRLAFLEAKNGNRLAATDALRQAVAMEGPSGPAGEAFRSLIASPEEWSRYAAALREFIAMIGREDSDRSVPPETFLELARVEVEQLQQGEQALATLTHALKLYPDNTQLRGQFGIQLSASGHHQEAAKAFQAILAVDVRSADAWRALSRSLDEMNQTQEARLALSPVVLLGAASSDDLEILRSRAARPAHARPGTFTPERLRGLSGVDPATQAAEALLQSMAEGLGKLYGPELERFGLSTRDKLAPEHPIRALAAKVGQLFNLETFDVYLHRKTEAGVSIELGDPPAILLPHGLSQVSEAHQVFALARPLAYLARDLHPVCKLTPQEVELMLVAAARSVAPRFGLGLSSEEYLNREVKRITKALSRKGRKQLEEAAESYVNAPKTDFPSWCFSLERTAQRVALLLSDDINASIDLVRAGQGLANLTGRDLIEQSNDARDLLEFWFSPAALDLRRQVGLLPTGAGW